jgi:hypothetical protein
MGFDFSVTVAPSHMVDGLRCRRSRSIVSIFESAMSDLLIRLLGPLNRRGSSLEDTTGTWLSLSSRFEFRDQYPKQELLILLSKGMKGETERYDDMMRWMPHSKIHGGFGHLPRSHVIEQVVRETFLLNKTPPT